MTTTPGIDELEEGIAWEKVLTLSYAEIAPFVISNLRRVSLPMAFVWIISVITLFLSVWLWPGLMSPSDNPQIITGLGVGLGVIPLLLIPLHEGLHLIPFRLAGASDIRMGTDLRQGIVYVTAHRFVAGRRLFTMVALTPFFIITTGLFIAVALCPMWWQWVLSMSLLVHTTMCAGDAALLGFMGRYKNRRLFTWDDADKKEAYFFASVRRENDL
jgi:Putative zincin peptidase